MRKIILRSVLAVMLFSISGIFTNCAKEGCPATQSLKYGTVGNGGGKQKKLSKNTSGLFPPAGQKKSNKY